MNNEATATVIADSISPQNIRLTTFQLRYWRPIHSELMTHRVFSRNAGSSRARPSARIIEQVRNTPWGPIHWGLNKPGMQATEEAWGTLLEKAKLQWHAAACSAADHAESFEKKGLHKQIVNRLLEPFTYIDVVVTATDYANWFALRDHPDAQPEIQDLARRMKQAMDESTPELIEPGAWHLPYITEDDWYAAQRYCQVGRITRDMPRYGEKLDVVLKISTARCARVSYKAFDGNVASIEDDLRLYDRLLSSQPLHASPAEHQATPDTINNCMWDYPHHHGNFRGWIQYRKTIPNEFVPD